MPGIKDHLTLSDNYCFPTIPRLTLLLLSIILGISCILIYDIILHSHELRKLIERNTDTKCLAICIAIQVFRVAIYYSTHFGILLSCTPTIHITVIGLTTICRV